MATPRWRDEQLTRGRDIPCYLYPTTSKARRCPNREGVSASAATIIINPTIGSLVKDNISEAA